MKAEKILENLVIGFIIWILGLYCGSRLPKSKSSTNKVLGYISLEATAKLTDEFRAYTSEKKPLPACDYGPTWRLLSKEGCEEMLKQIEAGGKPDPRFGPN